MSSNAKENGFKLAQYLLNYVEGRIAVASIEEKNSVDISAYPYYSDAQIIAEVGNILHKIKPHAHNVFNVYHGYLQHNSEHSENLLREREEKSELLEKHNVYDKNILFLLKNFLIMTLALLIELERLHKIRVLCGAVNPYTFTYNTALRTCEFIKSGIAFPNNKIIKIEPYDFGEYFYISADLSDIENTKYLAPELRESVRMYLLQHRLNELLIEIEARKLNIEEKHEILLYVHEYHQKKIKYTNRAEIYSVGYTLNQILSHMLSKLIHFNMFPNEFITFSVAPNIIHEAELLLPHKYVNPEEELVVGLLNEAVEYIYDLMHNNVEKRDSLELSIEKFSSLLKRTSVTKPDNLLEAEEEQAETELDDKVALEEEAEEGEELEKEEEKEKEEAENEIEEAEHEEEDEDLEEEEEIEVEEGEEIEEAENELGESEEQEEETEEAENEEEPEDAENEPEEADELENEENEEEPEEDKEEHEVEEEDHEEEADEEREAEEQHEPHADHADHDHDGEHEESHKQHGDSEHNDSNNLSHDDDEPPPSRSGFRPGH